MKSIEHDPKTPQAATGLFALLDALFHANEIGAPETNQGAGPSSSASVLVALVRIAAALLAGAALIAALPAVAGAYATIEGPPLYSTAPGLPDGRVYEQVSPADKNSNEAGATSHSVETSGAEQRYGFAAADGNSVLFEGTGPMGEVASPLNNYFVASKNPSATGWTTRASTPRPQQRVAEVGGTLGKFEYIDPSSDLSHVMFEAGRGSYALDMPSECTGADEPYAQMYLSGSDPFVPATWLERPAIEDPVEVCSGAGEGGVPDGGTPNFSTVYFTYPGTLLPEDATRAPHAQGSIQSNERLFVEAWGFYEDREGVLREAGVLPDGKLDEFGAVPAASEHGRATAGNQVSTRSAPGAPAGSRAFFVSPDPASCEQNGTPSTGQQNNCAVDPPELYVRENGTRTLLVSRDTLLPEAGGLPAAAPGGVSKMPNPTSANLSGSSVTEDKGSYVFASPNGSQAFFQSEAALTKPAEESSPGTELKTYDFDVETGALTYLPGIAEKIEILATDANGSAFAFVKPEAGGAPAELDLWSADPDGGSVSPVTQLPGGAAGTARMSSDGSVIVFTAAGLPDFNDAGAAEIFRYDVSAKTLGCVSCAPRGVTPTGRAQMSSLRASEEGTSFKIRGTAEERGMSTDGSRIFFDTPDPLVPQDKNSNSYIENGKNEFEKEGRDVYEWENGVVYLISSGKSALNSYLLDNSENGDDLFFATTEGLVPGDTDGAYDVYDARVLRPGEPLPPPAVPCEGSVCQGPPNAPSPLTPPASATFSGLGNAAPEPAVTTIVAKKTTTKTIKCKKGDVKKKSKCVKSKPRKNTKLAKKASHNGRAK